MEVHQHMYWLVDIKIGCFDSQVTTTLRIIQRCTVQYCNVPQIYVLLFEPRTIAYVRLFAVECVRVHHSSGQPRLHGRLPASLILDRRAR